MIMKGCWFVCLMGVSLSSQALEWYAGLDANYIQTKVKSASGEAKFLLPAMSFRLGTYLQPQLGLEFYGLSGVTDDSDENIKLNVDYSIGVTTRFETPESEGGKIFFLIGYGWTQLDMDRSHIGSPGKQSFGDFSLGGGVEFKLGKASPYYLNVQALRYYSGDDITLNGASMGLRYRF